MKAKTLAIGLFADRIDLLVCHGDRVARSKRVAVSLPTERGEWDKALRTIAKPLEAAAAELKALTLPVCVLYRSPSQCAEYAGMKFRSASEAREAAVLGCADLLSCPIDLAVTSAAVVGRDPKSPQAHTHVVVGADSDEAVSAIAAMVEAAGLHFEAAIPLDAVIMAHRASEALRHAGSVHGFLHIGERQSFFVVAGKHALLFARPVALGTDALVTSLTRPIRSANAVEPIELDPATARTLLHTHGFADRKTVVHERLGLTGGQIIPLLQPTVQRFIVELRQSLRFGLSEEQRRELHLKLSGPGSVIPGLERVIAAELEAKVQIDARYLEHDWRGVASAGSELAEAVACRSLVHKLSLAPQHIARLRYAGRLRRWLWSGAAAAMLLVGLETMNYHAKVAQARLNAQAAADAAVDRKAQQTSADQALSSISAMNALEARIALEHGSPVNLRAVLQELSRLTPEPIRLTNIAFSEHDSGSIGTLSGYAFDRGSVRGTAQLEPFIDLLRKSPLFESVVLANVQAGSMGDATGQRFEASFKPVQPPARSDETTMETAAAGQTGVQP